jgi:hypothetical protein
MFDLSNAVYTYYEYINGLRYSDSLYFFTTIRLLTALCEFGAAIIRLRKRISQHTSPYTQEHINSKYTTREYMMCFQKGVLL